MIINNLLLLAIVVPIITLSLALLFQVFRLLFAYKITDKEIIVLLFHFLPIYKVPFNKIVAMHVASVWEVAIVPGMHLFTRPFAKRVVIEQKDRRFIFAFFTPGNPDVFISEIKKHLEDIGASHH